MGTFGKQNGGAVETSLELVVRGGLGKTWASALNNNVLVRFSG